MKRSQLSSFLLLLFASLIIVSCSKKDDPSPASLSDQVAGNYTLTGLDLGGLIITIPIKDDDTGITTSGKIEVKKVTDDTASATLIMTETETNGKATTDSEDLGTVTLKKAASGEIEAYQGTVKVATYNNNELKLTIIDEDFGNMTLIAKK